MPISYYEVFYVQLQGLEYFSEGCVWGEGGGGD